MINLKEYARKITNAWQKSIDSIFECGDLLIEAKGKLKHGEFQKMIEELLPFKPRTAEMLMKIAADTRLTNAKHASLLPSSWYTLYRLTTLSDEHFEAALADGTIHPEMTRADIPERVHVTRIETPRRESTVSVEYVDAPATPTRVVDVHYVEPQPRLSDMRKAEDRAERLVDALESLAELADSAVRESVLKMLRELDHERQTRVRQAVHAIGIIENAVRWSNH